MRLGATAADEHGDDIVDAVEALGGDANGVLRGYQDPREAMEFVLFELDSLANKVRRSISDEETA